MTTYRLYFINGEPGTVFERAPYVLAVDSNGWRNHNCIFFDSIEQASNYINTNRGAMGGFGRDGNGLRYRVVKM